MTNNHNKILGNYGEAAACVHLNDKGYTIRRRNYRCPDGEIDIIAELGHTLVFVEVKTRQTDDYGTPAEAITSRKVEKIIQIIKHYLAATDYSGILRVDAIEVYGTLKWGRFSVSKINHIENIVN